MCKKNNKNSIATHDEINSRFLEEDLILLVDKFTKIESAPLRYSVLNMIVELSDGIHCVSCGEQCEHLSMIKMVKHLKDQEIVTIVRRLLEEHLEK
jgi:hypothetical protein